MNRISPFLLPLAALVAGILLGDYLEGPVWGFIPVAFALCLYLFLLVRSKTPLKAYRINPWHKAWIFSLFLGIGLFTSFFHKPMKFSDDELRIIAGGKGEVTEVSTLAAGDRLHVGVWKVVDTNGRQYDCRNLNIIVRTDGFSTKCGDVVIFSGKLRKITDNPNERNKGYAAGMNRRGFLYETVADANHIKIKSFSNSIRARSAEWRDRIEIALEKSSLDRGASEFLCALLLGDKSMLTPDVRQTFSNAGVAHVLALSGMHVAIILGLFSVILFPLSLAGVQRPRYWAAIAGIWIFAFLTGLSPSTIRACLMSTFVAVAITFQRRRNAGNALLASLFVILLLTPSAVYDAGLQLSFLSVACILLFAAQLNPVNRHLHPRLHAATSSVLVSLVATMGTWVLVSYYFKRIPMLFLPANLILLPLLPLYMGTALLYTVMLLCGHDISFLSSLLNHGYSSFMLLLEKISQAGNYTINFQATFPVVILWIVGILLLGYAINRRKKFSVISLSLLFLAGSAASAPLLAENPEDTLIFQKKYTELSAIWYEGSDRFTTVFPRNTVSRIIKEKAEIIAIDCSNAADSLPRWLDAGSEFIDKSRKLKNRKKLYLLIGSGARLDSLAGIPGIETFDKIILHSSIRKKREKQILDEARKIGLSSVHSLREDGPLEQEL